MSSLEANLFTGILHSHLFVFELVVGVVKFRNNSEDPKGLSVKLLLKVTLKKIHHAELVADDRDSKDIAE